MIRWRIYKDWPYRIYEDGDIISTITHKKLVGGVHRQGYRTVQLRNSNGEMKTFYIHRLVALTFLDNPNNYPEVNHKDFNKSNNNVSNLEWVSRSGNMQHAHSHNVMNLPKGIKHPQSRLTEKQVKEIREMYSQGYTFYELGKIFNIHQSNASYIVNRKTWKHII